MSPLEIHCLLEYYTMPDGSPDIHYRHSMAIESLLRYGLIGGHTTDSTKPMHSITDKGMAMVNHLCSTPLPECRWIVPKVTAEDRHE